MRELFVDMTHLQYNAPARESSWTVYSNPCRLGLESQFCNPHGVKLVNRYMARALFTVLLLSLAAWAANVKLYLKDGSYHIVREYKVDGDRVRFYSTERSQWEEIPVALVDIKRTQSEVSERKAALAEEAKILSAEDKAERALQDEIMRIPQNPGVYYLEGKDTKRIKAAESIVHTNKGRSILKAVSPIPVVTGKATLEIQQAHSLTVLGQDRPVFYIQLEKEERFGIVKLTPHNGVRIVEKITTVPVTKEIMEEPEEVEIFRKQLTPDGLYKIWPEKPLEPGEYAVIEYTPGKLNMQVFDFAYKPAK